MNRRNTLRCSIQFKETFFIDNRHHFREPTPNSRFSFFNDHGTVCLTYRSSNTGTVQRGQCIKINDFRLDAKLF